MSGSLIFVSGKDPLGDDPGHSSYVRAHALAAVRAGYRPLVLCVGRKPMTTESDFGTVVRVRSRAPARSLFMPLNGPVLARRFAGLARRLPHPVLGHGFAVWTFGAVAGSARVRAAGGRAGAIMSAYATHPAESRSHLLGAGGEPAAARLSYLAQAGWSEAVISRFESAALRGADAAFANYHCVRDLVRRRYGNDLELTLLPYATEMAFRGSPAPSTDSEPAGIRALEPRDAPLLVTASSHHGRKGMRTLIEALALVRDRGHPLRACLLGAGPLLEPHRRLVDELGLSRSVVATGWVADQVPYLRRADLFALPSLAEQSGSVALLEAMQCGAAIVASAVDGIAEDASDGEDCLLAPPGDAGSLAAALAELAAQPELRARLGAAARATYESRFSAQALSEALTEVYSSYGVSPP
jgi:glycosyltransferase involved in cell wall biosynthesis